MTREIRLVREVSSVKKQKKKGKGRKERKEKGREVIQTFTSLFYAKMATRVAAPLKKLINLSITYIYVGKIFHLYFVLGIFKFAPTRAAKIKLNELSFIQRKF